MMSVLTLHSSGWCAKWNGLCTVACLTPIIPEPRENYVSPHKKTALNDRTMSRTPSFDRLPPELHSMIARHSDDRTNSHLSEVGRRYASYSQENIYRQQMRQALGRPTRRDLQLNIRDLIRNPTTPLREALELMEDELPVMWHNHQGDLHQAAIEFLKYISGGLTLEVPVESAAHAYNIWAYMVMVRQTSRIYVSLADLKSSLGAGVSQALRRLQRVNAHHDLTTNTALQMLYQPGVKFFHYVTVLHVLAQRA